MMKKIRPLFTLMTVLFVSVFLSFILKEDSSSGNLTNEIKRCATTEYMEMKLQNDNVYRKNLEEIQKYIDEYLKKNKIKDNLLITIPTVVHVVYNVNNPLQNISYQQVLSQIRVMNEDFRRLNRDTINTPAPFKPVAADIQVEFCLAKRDPNNNPSIGVTRTATTVTEFGLNDAVKFNASGGHDAWDRDKYLNIWVCNLQSTLLGYAQFPGGPAATDGVVIDYQGFGTIGTATFPYNLGRTTIHEVGHWLYLFHIWGDDNGACWGTDQVDDTPNQASEFYGCPIYPTVDACTPSSPGVMFMNYMDYTDDRCMNIFTQGQSVRMNAVMNGFRAPLQTSNGCTPVSGVPIAMFTADSVSIQYANPVHFFDISGGIPTSWNWSFPGGTPQSSSVQNPTIIYNTPGLYSVSLRVSNASGSDSITFVNYIRVRGAVLNSFGLVSPPSFSRIYVSSNDPTIENFTWQKSSTNPTVFYKFKIRKIASTEYSYLSNNSGTDSVISLRRGFLDSLAAAMGTTGDSVRCSWRVFAFNGIDSLASSTTFLVTLVRSPIGIQKISSEVPDKFALYNNYPNPFNPSTTIRFDIPAGLKNEFIKLTIYDITGRQVEMLLNEKLEPGKYSADWNSINYSSGIYFYRILAGQYTDTKKMILVK